jgi:hypothetical protein
MSGFFWGGAIAAMILLSATPGRAAEPVTRIDVYVTPYFAAAEKPDGKPTVAVGETFNALLASNRREDIVAARDLVEQQPDKVTPMTMMVLSIRLYDVALRDDAVFWFYAAKGRYITLASVIDVGAAGLAEVDAGMGAFVQLAGPVINGYAFCDVARQQATLAASIDWIEAHPYAVIFMDRLPARPGDRKANLAAAVADLRANAAKESAYLADPKNLSDLKAKRQENESDAKYCW